MGRPIVVTVLGDTRNLVKSLGDGESRLSKFGKAGKIAGAAVLGGAAVAGTALVGFGIKAVQSASNAQQSLGATETVFGKFAGSIVKNSDRAAQSVGLSANEYRESANLIGSLFKNQGVAADKLAGKTDNMVRTGADLAATYGGTTKDAVEALGSAFKGEFDPLEKYGISIKQSTINAELAARGEDKLTGAALTAAKQRATTRLLTQQAGDALGAFGRESNTLAGQQQRLGASWENIKAKAGSALLPALTSVASFANTKLLPGLAKMATGFRPVAQEIGARLAPAISRVKPLLVTMGTAITGTVLPTVIRLAKFLGSTFGPVFLGIGRILVGQVLPTVIRFGTFIYGTLYPAVARIVTQVGGSLAPVFKSLAATFTTQILPAVSSLMRGLEAARPTIQRVILVTLKITGVVLRFAGAILGRVLPPVIRLAGFLAGTLIRAIGLGVRAIARIISVAVSFGRGLVNVARNVVSFGSKVISAITSIPGRAKSALGNAARTLLQKGRDLIVGIITGAGEKFGAFGDKIRAIPGKAKDALGALGSTLKQKGRDLIQGLVDGIGEKIGAAVQKVRDGLQKIKDLLPGSPIKDGPLKPWNNKGPGGPGGRLIGLLAAGLRNTRPIDSAMRAVTGAIQAPTSLARPVVRMAAAGLAGGIAGGVTINITLEVPVGATGADIGRELAQYLKDYFAAGGARP